MKMVTKRTHCPACSRLVMPKVQGSGETTKLICPFCDMVLYVKEDWGWRFPKEMVRATTNVK